MRWRVRVISYFTVSFPHFHQGGNPFLRSGMGMKLPR